MRQISHCKFCGTQITLDIDDEYSRLGDPFNIQKLAACNRCADLRHDRRRLEEALSKACYWIETLTPQVKIQKRDKIKARLDALTQKYAKFVARWYNLDGMWWEDDFSMMLLDHPDKWPKIISDYWTHFRRMNPPKLL